MSWQSLQHLKETYNRVLTATIAQAQKEEIIQDTGLLEELERRWRSRLKRSMEEMEAQNPFRFAPPQGREARALLDPALPPDMASKAAKSIAPVDLEMDAGGTGFELLGPRISFRQRLPALPEVASTPPVVAGTELAFSESNIKTEQEEVFALAPVQPSQPTRPAKRRPAPEAQANETDVAKTPLLPPLGAKTKDAAPGAATCMSQIQPVQNAPLESDDEYAGCFENAIVVRGAGFESPPKEEALVAGDEVEEVADAMKTSAPSAQTGRGPETSDGSELGSDLDGSDFDEPETRNELFAPIEKMPSRGKKAAWKVQLGPGVLKIQGVELLFARAEAALVLNDPISKLL